MNAPEKIVFLADVQAQVDNRELRIDAVGIRGIRCPITILAGTRLIPTIATLSMTVGLSDVAKGTHMSRFVELLEAQTGALDQQGFKAMVFDMLDRLDARSGSVAFPAHIVVLNQGVEPGG